MDIGEGWLVVGSIVLWLIVVLFGVGCVVEVFVFVY